MIASTTTLQLPETSTSKMVPFWVNRIMLPSVASVCTYLAYQREHLVYPPGHNNVGEPLLAALALVQKSSGFKQLNKMLPVGKVNTSVDPILFACRN